MVGYCGGSEGFPDGKKGRDHYVYPWILSLTSLPSLGVLGMYLPAQMTFLFFSFLLTRCHGVWHSICNDSVFWLSFFLLKWKFSGFVQNAKPINDAQCSIWRYLFCGPERGTLEVHGRGWGKATDGWMGDCRQQGRDQRHTVLPQRCEGDDLSPLSTV